MKPLRLGYHIKTSPDIISNIERVSRLYQARRVHDFRIAVQIFTKAPAQFAKSKLTDRLDVIATREYCRLHDVFIVVHGIYLANFCNFADSARARASVVEDLRLIEKLSPQPHKTGVVIHLGSNTFKKPIDDCIADFIANLLYCLDYAAGTAKILLETSVKSMNGKEIFHDIQMLGKLFAMIPTSYKKRIGFVIDSCHIFSSGYDIRARASFERFIALWDKVIGIRHVMLFHLNDSKLPLDCRRDLHAEISRGYIFEDRHDGLKAILRWCRLRNIPIVMETKSDQNREFDFMIKMIKSL